MLWASNAGRTYVVPLNPLFPTGVAQENLSVDMARIEGLAEAMAANLLKSPYLADTTGTIRNTCLRICTKNPVDDWGSGVTVTTFPSSHTIRPV